MGVVKKGIIFFLFNLHFLAGVLFFPSFVFATTATDLEQCQDAGYTELGGCKQNGRCEPTIYAAGKIAPSLECTGCPTFKLCCQKPEDPNNTAPLSSRTPGCINKIPDADTTPSVPVKFKPQVTIPGTIFTAGKEIEIDGDTFAKYVSGFYKFFIGFMIVAAVVMIMWGGLKRIAATGSAEKIKDANETIFAALIGLVITLISYSLLNLINPSLVEFKTLDIYKVKKEEFTLEVDEEVAAPPPAAGSEWTKIAEHPNLFLDSDARDYPYLRKDTNVALLTAAEMAAREGIIIEVNYAARTKAEQQKLYNKHCQSGICNPPTCNPNKKCPHTSGGAVDVVCKGRSSKDTCQSKLQEIMLKADFCRLSSEAWHFEYPHMSSKCNIKKS